MKKLLAILLAVLVVVGVAGCSASQVADGLDAAQLLIDPVSQLQHAGFQRLHHEPFGIALLQRKQQNPEHDDGNDKNQDKIDHQLRSQIEMMTLQSESPLFSVKIL